MKDQDTYSRLIAWLKIVLPLVALAILSTLFLVARTIDPEDAIPYADVDVGERLREPRMTQPTYAGVTDDGSALNLSAAEARPEDGANTSGTAKTLSGALETPDGGRVDFAAARADIDAAARLITLTGGVEIKSSTGWVVVSEGLTANMDQTDIQTQSDITAIGPAGTVTAQKMRLTQGDAGGADAGKYLLVFNGAVKLIYRPQN